MTDKTLPEKKALFVKALANYKGLRQNIDRMEYLVVSLAMRPDSDEDDVARKALQLVQYKAVARRIRLTLQELSYVEGVSTFNQRVWLSNN